MKHTFAFCPTRKELVWLENPPEVNSEHYYPDLEDAIADAPVVSSDSVNIIYGLIYKSLVPPWPSENGNWNPIESHLYEVEIEGEMEEKEYFFARGEWHTWDTPTGINGKEVEKVETFCRLIPKPKQENDMKEPVCEKCWTDAYARSIADTSKVQYEHYLDLLNERKDNPCDQPNKQDREEVTPPKQNEIWVNPNNPPDLSQKNEADFAKLVLESFKESQEDMESQVDLWAEVQKVIDTTTPGKHYMRLMEKFTIHRK